MFDLNELPEDDIDMLPPCDDVACNLQATPKLVACRQKNLMLALSGHEVGNANMCIDHDAFPVHQVDLVTLPLGQHPLSCFHTFVRPILKGVFENGAVFTAKEGAHPMRSMLDQQNLATSCNQGGLNGEHVRIDNISLKQIVDTAPITSDSRRGPRIGHGIFGPEDCNGIVQRLKNPGVQELPGFPSDGKEESLFSNTIVKAPEVQEKASLRSAVVDACMKVDGSKGISSTVESKLPSSFVKRDTLDQKDAMLGKKRARQTMFLDVREAAKQAPPPRASGGKKGSSLSMPRNHKEAPKTPATLYTSDTRLKESKSSSLSCDGFRVANSLEPKASSIAPSEGIIADGQAVATTSAKSSCLKGDGDERGEGPQLNMPMVWRHPGGSRGKLDGEVKPASYVRPLAKRNLNNYKKQFLYAQDSSIERLHREATCEKLWKSPAATSMLCPVERRLRVFIVLQFRVETVPFAANGT